jgi:peptidoglycan/xylan/chitin deacetylase (PgdA/CDA1 family)
MIRLLRVAAVCAAFLLTIVPSVAQAATLGVPVLMYHRVAPDVPSDAVGRSLTIDPKVFDAQLTWLQAHGIRTLTMDELIAMLARNEHPQHAVVLTFDDGYVDAATYATPLLQKHGLRGSFYVSAGFIGDGRHASWKQLRSMRAAGMEIGCHGTEHLDLSTLDRAGAEGEIGHCEQRLSHYLGRPTTYAYAAGKWNDTTIAVLREHGFAAALTERPGLVHDLAQPFELPRRRVDRSDDLTAFAALATP